MHEQNDKLTRIAARRFLQLVRSSGSDYVLTPAGDLVVQPTGGQLIVRQSGGVAGTDDLTLEHDGTDAHIKSLSGDVIVTPAGGDLILRQSGGVAGTDDLLLSHNGTNAEIRTMSGAMRFIDPTGSVRLTMSAGASIDVTAALNPTTANARTIGTASLEWLSLYLGEDASSGVFFGLDQDVRIYYDEATDDILKLTGNGNGNGFEFETTLTITGAVTDGYVSALRLDPGYTAATAQTVTRHNYIDIQDVSVAGAGPAAVTDACVFRFDAAAGTHKATVGATTKTTPGGVDAWLKININGTLYYVPAYTSTTA